MSVFMQHIPSIPLRTSGTNWNAITSGIIIISLCAHWDGKRYKKCWIISGLSVTHVWQTYNLGIYFCKIIYSPHFELYRKLFYRKNLTCLKKTCKTSNLFPRTNTSNKITLTSFSTVTVLYTAIPTPHHNSSFWTPKANHPFFLYSRFFYDNTYSSKNPGTFQTAFPRFHQHHQFPAKINRYSTIPNSTPRRSDIAPAAKQLRYL